jgi:dienelactone hydrolase
LRLAVVDPAENVAYIGRPGQYSLSGFPECDSKYWSGYRFAPEVVESFNKAIDILKEKSGADHVILVGYSGGGAVAVLVAAERSDVVAFRTVAGNLNSEALSTYHHVTHLDGSMNPLDVAYKVAHIPQRHFVGSRDKIVPFAIVKSFVKMEKGEKYECITVVDGASHNDGWQRRWKELLAIPL